MHMMLATVTKEKAATSEEARRYVFDALMNDGYFVGGSRFGVLFAWFVIGGEWSGALAVEPEGKQWPTGRDPYYEMGYEDDAMIVDELLYDAFLAPYIGAVVAWESEGPVFVDLDQDPVSKGFIGQKWLVVLDCHE
jgi:hypothetical protein